MVLTVTIAALLTVAATYSLLRVYEALTKREANPATVIWSAKIAMFWRLDIGLYFAGMVAFGAVIAARKDLERTIRVLFVAAHVVAATVAVQGIFFP